MDISIICDGKAALNSNQAGMSIFIAKNRPIFKYEAMKHVSEIWLITVNWIYVLFTVIVFDQKI